jgi:hypothetical protein
MKYWKEDGWAGGLKFADSVGSGLENDRVLCVSKGGDYVVIREACDNYFSVALSPDDAVGALRELADFIEKDFKHMPEER